MHGARPRRMGLGLARLDSVCRDPLYDDWLWCVLSPLPPPAYRGDTRGLGAGFFAPKTTGGRVFSIVFSFFGIGVYAAGLNQLVSVSSNETRSRLSHSSLTRNAHFALQLFKLSWQYVKEQYFPPRRNKLKEEDYNIDLDAAAQQPAGAGSVQMGRDESDLSCSYDEDATMTRIHVEFEDEVELGACCVPEVELEICPGSPTPSTPRTPLSKSTSFFGAPPTMTQAAHNAAATMKKDEDEYGNEQADTTLEKSRLQALIKPILLTTVFLLACGLLYTEAEGWDFGVACYFWFITFSTIGEERVCRPVGVVSADFAPVRVHFRARRLCTCTRESNRNCVSDHDRPRVSVEFAQCDPGGQPCPLRPISPLHTPAIAQDWIGSLEDERIHAYARSIAARASRRLSSAGGNEEKTERGGSGAVI